MAIKISGGFHRRIQTLLAGFVKDSRLVPSF
ncbi:hypothetical protein ZOSMA_34G00550 [Zostera marina]|uniref:Uncharacterized protein n=1 Tax=Zostera marina TaxID=29655 RepID=A0A0K9P951_ZOSMR|nr:hypothetical protein ZOSMA_34G00550 [Zostera marina]